MPDTTLTADDAEEFAASGHFDPTTLGGERVQDPSASGGTPRDGLREEGEPSNIRPMTSLRCQNLIFSRHGLERLLQRRISPAHVREVVEHGEIIESYQDERPFPSFLLLGIVPAGGGQPLHVVLGYDSSTETGYVVTTYVPDPAIWHPDWKTRR